MKLGLVLAALMLCQMSWAQSMREKRIKEEMLERVDTLIEKVELTREDLDREDVFSACGKIKEIFAIYPEHLKSIGMYMDLLGGKTSKARNDALNQLIFIHRQTLICDEGKECEYVDPKKLAKELKSIEKSLKKQRKTIKKEETDRENSFYYHYEF